MTHTHTHTGFRGSAFRNETAARARTAVPTPPEANYLTCHRPLHRLPPPQHQDGRHCCLASARSFCRQARKSPRSNCGKGAIRSRRAVCMCVCVCKVLCAKRVLHIVAARCLSLCVCACACACWGVDACVCAQAWGTCRGGRLCRQADTPTAPSSSVLFDMPMHHPYILNPAPYTLYIPRSMRIATC